MAFERKYKGATEFLRASKLPGSRSAGSGSFAESAEDGNAALDSAVMNALFRGQGSVALIATAISAPPTMVDAALERLLDQGFVETPDKGKPYTLTEAGQRYLKYSQLTKY